MKKVLTPAVATSAGVKLTIKARGETTIYLLQREQAIALLHNLMAEVSATLESTLTGADAAGIGQGTLSCDLGVRSIDGSDVAGVVGDNISVAVIALHN